MSEYNSFYGGRRGASFIIVKNYASIEEMINHFKLGAEYKTVNYDEYVLINTVSKNDADNGKVFRRGYEYNNEAGGAVYVGQIVGPAGMAPHTELTTIDEVKKIQEQDNFSYRKGEGSYAPLENLIPGKYIEDGIVKYNDEIQWAYCSVRDKDSNESTAHIGFKFPFLVTEIEADSKDAYFNRDNETADFINTDLIQRVDDQSHPYYNKWHINIPKGIKGDALKNLKIITANAGVQKYTGQDDDIKNQRQILVYDYYNYDKDPSGEPVALYLGDYNMIQDVILENDGSLTIKYTHDDDRVFDKKIKWIKDINLNTANGQFVINYNEGSSYTQTLKYPKQIDIHGENGKIKMTYSNNEVVEETLIYPIAVSLDGHTGAFSTTFTNDTKYQTTLVFPKNIEIDTGAEEGAGNQKLTVQYSDGTSEASGFAINYIMDTACGKDTGLHLYVLFSDPAKRAQGPNVTYKGRNDWTDLGFIGGGDVGCVTATENDPGATQLMKELPPFSTWLIIEE